jgi:hypothetical protein
MTPSGDEMGKGFASSLPAICSAISAFAVDANEVSSSGGVA